MTIDWTGFGFPKGAINRRRPTPKLRQQSAKQAKLAPAIRRCYRIVDERDLRTCRFPGCGAAATSHHHLIFRSQSKALQAAPSNVICLCQQHDALIHALAQVRVEGNADEAVVWSVTTLGLRAGVVLPFTVVRPPTAVLQVPLCPVPPSRVSSPISPNPNPPAANGSSGAQRTKTAKRR